MTSFRIKASNNGYQLVEPLNDIQRSYGYLMVLNTQKKVLRFYPVGFDAEKNAREYLKYISLSKWDKLKYWISYKRGSRGF